MYIYTKLRQDGRFITYEPSKTKWTYEQLKNQVNGMVEIIPKNYYPIGMNGTVYGNEEARFNSDNTRNQCMLVIKDDLYGDEWDTVGDLLLEQTEKQYEKWYGQLAETARILMHS